MLNEAVTLHRRFPYAVLAGFFVLLADFSPEQGFIRAFKVNDLEREVPLDEMFEALIERVAERNFDSYEAFDSRGARSFPGPGSSALSVRRIVGWGCGLSARSADLCETQVWRRSTPPWTVPCTRPSC